MGIPVMVLGASGSGKSTSLRNFKPDEIGIFNVASKPLPFRGKGLLKVDKASYPLITKVLRENKLRCYAIDDSQFLMVFDEFNRAKEVGYQKFTDFALNFYNLVQTVINDTSPDTVVYFLHHTDLDDYGHIKAKTVGKMIDNKLTLEGMFSVVLLCGTDGKEHWFETQSDGSNTAKTPLEMFPDARIPNDLKMVDDTIREYWGLKPIGGKSNGSNNK